ncbi:hypothetical protein BDV19DRAFT_209366 [Aspergillus venezuelensis]
MPFKKDPNTSTRGTILSIRNASASLHRTTYKPTYDHFDEKEYCTPDPAPAPCNATTLRIRRLASRLNPLPRTQTATGLSSTRKSIFTSSRVPTPTEKPKDDLYSHSMYQREGRRSVLSPLRAWDISNTKTRKAGRQVDNHNNNTSERLTRPFSVIGRPSAHRNDGRKVQTQAQAQPLPKAQARPQTQAQAHNQTGKERDKRHSVSHLQSQPRFYQAHSNRIAFLGTTTRAETRTTMASPRRIRLTKGFEDLKAQDPQRTKLPMLKHNLGSSPRKPPSQMQKIYHPQANLHGLELELDLEHEQAKENDSPVYRPSWSQNPTPIPPLPPLPPPPPRREPYHTVYIPARIPTRLPSPKRRPSPGTQVETAMPQGYWLGRLMTLTNAFHYEDSFHAPDIATGFEMPSAYCRPLQGSNDGDSAAYRVKRAFMVLENLCVTDVASKSLRGFRDAYSRQFGNRWMD